MRQQELLDILVIGQSPLTGRIYVGLPDKGHPNAFRCKTDFTERLRAFAPQAFPPEPTCPDCGARMNTNWGHCPECDEWREL